MYQLIENISVKCKVCGPSFDYDVVMQCPYCKEFFCENHISPEKHGCPVLQQTVIPMINLGEIPTNYSIQYGVRSRVSPKKSSKYYEEVLKNSPGIIMFGKEPVDLLIGTLLIFLAITGITNLYHLFTGDIAAARWAVIDFLIIAPGFILHELAHKYMAESKKYFARYVLHEKGILLTLLTVALGIGFIVPGFVAILGSPNKKENGEISVVGPLTNILFAIMGFIPAYIAVNWFSTTNLVLVYVLYRIVFINAFIALFNLLPVWNLDGKKIFQWNYGYWGFMTAISLGLFLYSLLYSPVI